MASDMDSNAAKALLCELMAVLPPWSHDEQEYADRPLRGLCAAVDCSSAVMTQSALCQGHQAGLAAKITLWRTMDKSLVSFEAHEALEIRFQNNTLNRGSVQVASGSAGAMPDSRRCRTCGEASGKIPYCRFHLGRRADALKSRKAKRNRLKAQAQSRAARTPETVDGVTDLLRSL
ncbi:hypothetical protein JX265_002172 [Neoarthrinium moseri]|uniref:Uncharacterized protein n=1 Tax=Neoarthrinium moseri TaxID=1658444 RepID=A0A9P9WU65_9PEZI|nr:hypothetical protein JX265_002172 [Neoarthrinium moseri]